MTMDMRKEIVDALERLKYMRDSKVKYRIILDFVREKRIDTTKNLRGYWFDLTKVPDKCIEELYNLVNTQLIEA